MDLIVEERYKQSSYSPGPSDIEQAACGIAQFPNLRTLHLRNYPVVSESTILLMDSNSCLEEEVTPGGTIFATVMAELLLHEIYPPGCSIVYPQRLTGLGTIAIGASTVADTHVSRQLQGYSLLEEVLKPRVFDVMKCHHPDGEQSVRARLIGEGLNALDDAKYYSDHLRILESRWAK